MADDIQQNININYKTNIETMTVKTKQYNAELGRTEILTSKYAKDLSMHQKQYALLGESVSSTGKKVNMFSGQLNSLAMRFVGLQAVVSYAQKGFQELKQWVSKSIDEFRQFEYKMAEVKTLMTGITEDIIPAMEKGVVNLSITYGKSVNDLTKGLYEIISAAIPAKDAIGLLDTVTKASIAGLTTVTGAVRTFTGVLNAYGLSAAHAHELSDQMFMAVVRGNFTFQDLESSLGYVVPIAANLGVKFEEVAAALSSATRQGQHIDSVTRGLGLLMQGIIDPTKEAAEAARKYGIDMTATALRVKGLKGFFEDVNRAVDEFGSQILPELIGNMRSLRVAIALTGDKGLKGFTGDLNLMQTAAGRTNKALTDMMNTQKTMVDILQQNMENLERGIGEAWSGFDIWWKKTQIWWGTLLSGGDADAAVRRIDNAFKKIRDSYIQNIVNTVDETADRTIFDKLMDFYGKTEQLSKIAISDIFSGNKLTEYIDVSDNIEQMAKLSKDADDLLLILGQIHDVSSKSKGELFQTVFSMMFSAGTGKSLPTGKTAATGMEEYAYTIDVVNKKLENLGLTNLNANMTIEDLGELIGKIKTKSSEYSTELDELVSKQQKLAISADDLKAAFEDMHTSISDTKTNIMMLKSEIADLEKQVIIPYKGFEGRMGHQLAVMVKQAGFDEFKEYSEMGIKYGDEYIKMLSNNVPSAIKTSIKTMYDYVRASEEMTIADKIRKDGLVELEIAMKKNNLEIMKLQLVGMMRRRGNTRAEQKIIKKLEMDNLKKRIEIMKSEYEAEVDNMDKRLSTQEIAYEEAKKIVEAYTDAERFALWKLKDTRAEDIQDMRDNIAYQKGILDERNEMLATKYTELYDMQSLYQTSLMTLSQDPDLKHAFEEITGMDAVGLAIESWKSFKTFMEGNEIPDNILEKVTSKRPEDIMKKIAIPSLTDILGSTYGGIINPLISQLAAIPNIFKQSGSHNIPQTGMYMLHKGEQVIPSGNAAPSSNVININIKVDKVSSEIDLQRFAAMAREAVEKGLMNANGVSKYKHR